MTGNLTTAQAEYEAAVIEHVTTLRRSRRWADRRGVVARKITERGHMLADAAVREANAASGASIRKLIGQRDEEGAAKVRAEAALAVAEAHHEEVLADLRRDLAKAQSAAADWAHRCAQALQERDDVTEERDRLREQVELLELHLNQRDTDTPEPGGDSDEPPPLSRDLSGDLDALPPHAVAEPAPAAAPAAKKATTTRKPPAAKPAAKDEAK